MLTNEIETIVNERDWVTFAELSRIDGFTNEEENMGMIVHMGKREKILWTNMSMDACHAINELLNTKRVCLAMASKLSYLVDGLFLKDRKWLPVAFRPAKFGNDTLANGWLINNQE